MAAAVAGSTGRIFISYRRDETAYPAGWLYDRLANVYGSGQIFKDIDSIELGDDFVQVITSAVGSCDVLLALMGEEWLTLTDGHGRRRLDDPDDFVRLEIEAALTRNVLVIPILIAEARMPRAEELPPSLLPLTRRQALELSPSRFEYDTGRLMRVLDTALAEARAARDDAAATSVASVLQDSQNTAESVVPAVAGTTPGAPAGEDATTPQPAADPGAGDEGRSRANARLFGRTRTLRPLLLMMGVGLVALLAIYVTVQLVPDQRGSPPDGGAQSSATNELTEEAPWRLGILNQGSDSGCTVTMTNTDTREAWSNPIVVWDEASFLMPQGGTFRWSVDSGCTVFGRPGPGSLDIQAGVVVDGVGTSDAFEPPAAIAVTVQDFHGNQRCRLELRDVATGDVVDTRELNQEQESVTLQSYSRPLVYLVNDACAVRVAPG